MSRLVFTAEALESLKTAFARESDESCAVLYGRAVFVGESLARIVVREIWHPQIEDYSKRTPTTAQIRPEIVAAAANRARRTGESIIFAHSHPMEYGSFSPVDDDGEQRLRAFLDRRTPGVVHAALMIAPSIMKARILGTQKPLRVLAAGTNLFISDGPLGETDHELFDRQIRLFGALGQQIIRGISVGVVGVGGTGRFQQLAHLGVC